ncbi:hypothetical protein WG68_01540 [Arsukibacterium ikkense]|uniref:Beta-lactamase-related domain-containing protein n=2 Tax=Arsukibacterium ikkense TaxID=336831 RepID=A0A0M2VDZ1_9GAMM|nr:hypothetical protein WG68_01540 [Arsukibacterium ikkense]
MMLLCFHASAAEVTAFESFVQLQLKSDGPGLAYIVTKNGETIYSGAYGMANVETRAVLSPDSTFNIASVTKQFTAAAIMQLQQQGKLNVKDNINKYLPEFPTAGHVITIEHLLTHTSGLARNPGTGNQQTTEVIDSEQMLVLFAKEPMQFAPGEKMQYSNMGYKLLGLIIEVASGQPYGDYIEKNIFAKLGMKHSNYGNRQSGALKADGYYQSWQHGYQRARIQDVSWTYAGGGLASSANDLALWYRALLDGTFISQDSYRQMITPFSLNDGSSSNYGYGLNNIRLHNRSAVIHQGSLPGYKASAVYFPDEGIYATVLSNLSSVETFEFFSVLTGELFGLSYPSFEPVQLTASQQEQIMGDYQTSSGAIRKIFMEEGLMYSRLGNALVYAVTPLVNNTFLYGQSTSYFTIKQDTTGRQILSYYPSVTAKPEIAVKLQ